MARLPKPTFIDTDDDGALHMTWCFGEQGHPDSWRVFMFWQPGEGLFASKITHTPMTSEEAENEGVWPALIRWLPTQPESVDT